MRYVRFDDVNYRETRKQTDKLAPIRKTFSIVVSNFGKFYSPTSDVVTIDEQLFAFRGKCSIRQYIPSKPAKYGIKHFALGDVKSAYTINLETNVGSSPRDHFGTATHVVLRLVEPIFGHNRKVTGDNWFTSMSLITELTERNLTYVGAVRKNKRELPPQFLPNTQRAPIASLFASKRIHRFWYVALSTMATKLIKKRLRN